MDGSPGTTTDRLVSPILSIERGDSDQFAQLVEMHSHPEPKLLWTSTATVTVTTASREWLVPPGFGLWIPGGIEHGGSVLRPGEGSAITFAPDRCPITWTEPTGVAIGPLLRELTTHLMQTGPQDPTRATAETLMFELLTPRPAHEIQVAMPTDPRVRAIAERLIADPADHRELAVWADQVHSSVRTLSRLFLSETGLTFARWRTHVRIRAAIQTLANGATVEATARAVGYRKTSAFIATFRRTTGHTPGTYIHPDSTSGR
jgi:AraC-like DNA-binding protein